MFNKIIIALGSSTTVALIAFGLYSARELVTRTPICYWDSQNAFNAFDYSDTYSILLIGIGVGVMIMVTVSGLLNSMFSDDSSDYIENRLPPQKRNAQGRFIK